MVAATSPWFSPRLGRETQATRRFGDAAQSLMRLGDAGGRRNLLLLHRLASTTPKGFDAALRAWRALKELRCDSWHCGALLTLASSPIKA
jgi:hypothetical protein